MRKQKCNAVGLVLMLLQVGFSGLVSAGGGDGVTPRMSHFGNGDGSVSLDAEGEIGVSSIGFTGCHLRVFETHPLYRGKGYGTVVIKHFLNNMPHCDKITVFSCPFESDRSQRSLNNFYRKFGFTEAGWRKHDRWVSYIVGVDPFMVWERPKPEQRPSFTQPCGQPDNLHQTMIEMSTVLNRFAQNGQPASPASPSSPSNEKETKRKKTNHYN